MTKNKLLNIAIVICKIVKISYIIVFITLTSLLIHSQVSPELYKGVKINSKNSTFGYSKKTSWKTTYADDTKLEDKDVYTLDKISKTSLYLNYLQFSAILIFIFLTVKEFQKIMESVKSLNTFQKNNVSSFRKIGKYIFIIFLLMSFTFIQYQQGGVSGISLKLTPLLLMLIAFIMAEIFKEGNSLQQENDLTI